MIQGSQDPDGTLTQASSQCPAPGCHRAGSDSSWNNSRQKVMLAQKALGIAKVYVGPFETY